MQTTVFSCTHYHALADVCTLFEQEPMTIFLDSASEDARSRFSILGIHPYRMMKEENGQCFLWDYEENPQVPVSTETGFRRMSHSFETELEQYLCQNAEENFTNLPLISGAIGYFSYDYGRKFEQISTRHLKQIQMPEAFFIFYDLLLIEDRQEKKLFLAAQGKIEAPDLAFSRMEAMLEQCPISPVPLRHRSIAKASTHFTKTEYEQTIQKLIDYIVAGDVYIANLTQQLWVQSKKAPYDVYRYLRTYNPAPFAAYANYGSFQVACASPERFLYLKNNQVETRPIKGTRPRGATPKEDAFYKEELLHSQKDQSELLMIVDLERNDFNHVCVPGTVKVPQLFALETYPTVFHLVSTVTGTMRPDCSVMDLIRATFPGGSITGAPKIRAMELIDELERDSRGLYTGSMGYLSMNGDCDLNIVIRTAVYQDGVYHLGVGGGITSESDPAFEYEETLQKAKAVLEAIATEKEDT